MPVVDLFKYFGIAQVEILAPRNLALPVLPMRSESGRLIFSLCRTCTEEQHHEQCPHDNEALRSFTCTFPIAELKKAVEHGYVIKKVHEMHYCTKTSRTLFRQYMKKYFKIKLAYSGLDDEMCARFAFDQVAIEKYLRENSEKYCGFEIELDEDIAKKPALKFVAKLLFNSLLGRMGMPRGGGQKG